jgi:hypothetical protein
MPINTRLEADCRRNLFEPPRGTRPYLVTQRTVSRPGGAPSSSDTLGGGMGIEIPSTKLGELTPTVPAAPASGETPTPAITPPAVDHTREPNAFNNYNGTAGKPPRSGF